MACGRFRRLSGTTGGAGSWAQGRGGCEVGADGAIPTADEVLVEGLALEHGIKPQRIGLRAELGGLQVVLHNKHEFPRCYEGGKEVALIKIKAPAGQDGLLSAFSPKQTI